MFHRKYYERMINCVPIVDKDGLKYGSHHVMYWKEKPLMDLHAKRLCADKSDYDVLDIGFGLGVFFRSVIAYAPRSYTAIEANKGVVKYALKIFRDYHWTKTNMHIKEGLWQNIIDNRSKYDVIMSDTCSPKDNREEEFQCLVNQVCDYNLKENGKFSFFQNGELPDSRYYLLEKRFKHVFIETIQIDNLPIEWKKKRLFTVATSEL